MGALLQDLRFAVRTWRRAPVVAGAAILSMALGIGANTAIFSLVHTLILRPLPVPAPEQLVEILSQTGREPRMNSFWSRHYDYFRAHARSFSPLLAMSRTRVRLGEDPSAPATTDAVYVVGDFFQGLGVQPALGRLLGPDDERAGASGAAVISWHYWQQQFSGDPTAIGRPLRVNGTPMTIVGVTPRAFFGIAVGMRPDVWLPMAQEPYTQQVDARASNGFFSSLAEGRLQVQLIGRLRDEVSLDQARAEMRVLNQWRAEDLATTRNAPFFRQIQIDVVSASAGLSWLRDLFAGPLLILMIVVAALLLLACTNVAAMLLARASARQREMAVRVAVGAGRGRLVRQLLTESLLLSAVGAAIGIGVAIAGGDLLVRMLLSGRLPPGFPEGIDIQVRPDSAVLLFSAAAACVTGILFGLAPAAHAWSTAPIVALRQSTPAGDTRSRRLFGHGLVTVQVALSVVLLSAAGLLLSHVSNLKNVATGFQREGLLLVTLDPTRSGYTPQQLFRPYQLLLERLNAMPGVRGATLSAVTPIQGPGAARFVDVDGFQEAAEAKMYVSINWVSPRYFETYGTRLIAGREFQFYDEGRPRVAIVNQAMARYYFGGASPIGRTFRFSGQDAVYEIVGLVGDAKYINLVDPAPRTIYLHAFQEPQMSARQLSVRTDVGRASDVETAVADVLQRSAVTKITTLDQQMDRAIVIERVMALLSVFFGALGALLAAIGLYGLLAYTITRRTREIGVRLALGATPADVARMVLRGTVALVAVGIGVGLPLAFWGQRAAAHLLPNVTVGVVLPLIISTSGIALVALAAAYVPLRRATRIDPMVALRQE